MSGQTFVLFAVVLVIFLLVWEVVLVQEITHRADDLTTYIELRGRDSIAEFVDGPLVDLGHTIDSLRLDLVTISNNVVELKGLYQTKDETTGEIIYENESYYVLNKNTKQLITNDDYFLFPINTQKTSYSMTHPLIEFSTTFEFVGEETLSELVTYVFVCDAQNNDVTGSIPGFEDYVLTMDQKCKIWIEPSTGNQIRFVNDWETTAITHNDKITIEKGGTKTTPDFEQQQIKKTLTQKQALMFYYDVIPIATILSIISMLFLAYKYRIRNL